MSKKNDKNKLTDSGTFSVLRKSQTLKKSAALADSSASLTNSGNFYDEGDEDYAAMDVDGEGDFDYADNDFLLEDADQAVEAEFQIISKKEVESLIATQIEEAAQLLGVSLGDAAVILQFFGWNMDKLQGQYFDNPEDTFKKAGVVPKAIAYEKPKLKDKVECLVCMNDVLFEKTFPLNCLGSYLKDKVECLVCMNDVPFEKTFSLNCSHRFYCLDCWREYLDAEFKLKGATLATSTACIYPKCKVRVNTEAFNRLASADIASKFSYFFTKSFMDENPSFTTCSNPKCGNAVKFTGSGRPSDVVECDCGARFCFNCGKENHNPVSYPKCGNAVEFTGSGRPSDVVECDCGARFCFNCGKENHNPVSCSELETWTLRNQSDDESQKLIKLLSKPCFHCGRMTERVSGCNHMHCVKAQGGCGNHWCWMCGGDWKSHGSETGGYYSCNKYEKSTRFGIDQENEKVKAEMERFTHYFSRSFEHGVKEKDANESKGKTLEKQMDFREKTKMNPSFLMEALELLIKSRHSLKYTYVYGFFLGESDPFRPLFEMQQTKLESVTEALSDSLFAPLDKLDHNAVKNQTRVLNTFLANLVEAFEEQARAGPSKKAK